MNDLVGANHSYYFTVEQFFSNQLSYLFIFLIYPKV